MRPAACLTKSASSGRWLARQQSDPYVRARGGGDSAAATGHAGEPFRARSSFKLLELAARHPVLARGGAVVDLGAAPGGWAQVAASRVLAGSRRGAAAGRVDESAADAARAGRGRVLALDILAMPPIPGVDVWRGDFLDPAVRARLRAELGDVDTVLSDMMAPMTGVRARDVQASLDLVAAAAGFAKSVLRVAGEGGAGEGGSGSSGEGSSGSGGMGGSFVAKFFMHPDLLAFRKAALDPFFRKVVTDKPKASRAESSEAYWVCTGFKGPREP